MGVQLNPIAATLLVAIVLTAGFFVFYDRGEPAAELEEESEYAGKPLPSVFYKNHSTSVPQVEDSSRFARLDVPENNTVTNATAQLVVRSINTTVQPSNRTFVPRPVSSSSSSRRSSRGGGGGGNSNPDPEPTVNTTIPAPTTEVNASVNSTANTTTNVTITTPVLNNTNTTAVNTTQNPVNITPPVNTTPVVPPIVNTTPVNNTPVVNQTPTNTTNTTAPVNTTTEPPVKAMVSIVQPFPVDHNYVFKCVGEGFTPTAYTWLIEGEEETRTVDDIYHTFSTNGSHTVSCTATDGAKQATATQTITVSSTHPGNKFSSFITVDNIQDNTVTLTCHAVGYELGAAPWQFSSEEFNNLGFEGLTQLDNGGATITHNFPGPGEYSIHCDAINTNPVYEPAHYEEGQQYHSHECRGAHYGSCDQSSATFTITIPDYTVASVGDACVTPNENSTSVFTCSSTKEQCVFDRPDTNGWTVGLWSENGTQKSRLCEKGFWYPSSFD